MRSGSASIRSCSPRTRLESGADQGSSQRDASEQTVAADCTIPGGPGSDLSGRVLRGCDLSGANLSMANLNNTDFTEANLSEARRCHVGPHLWAASVHADGLLDHEPLRRRTVCATC
ncbi:MAG: pentapeptide repeat-containing protein [Actinomycetes bacterium]